MEREIKHLDINIILNRFGKSFWLLNITGWVTLWIINVAFYPEAYLTIRTMLHPITNILICFFLRHLFRKEKGSNITLQRIIIVILFSSALSSLFSNMFVMTLATIIETGNIKSITEQIFSGRFIYYSFIDTHIFTGWSILYFTLKVKNDYNIEKARNEESLLLAQKAELLLLRYQLNPHFLFNSLNSIRALTLKDPEGAKEMISELSEFFKYSVLTKNSLKTTLKREIEALNHYLTIEKIRFKEKLHIKYDVSGECKNYPIPVLLIHPIVENAIKYGMKTATLPLTISISGSIDDGIFCLEISNNGRWIDENERELLGIKGTSSGLQNVKDRLVNTYKNNHEFEIIKTRHFVSVRIKIIENTD